MSERWPSRYVPTEEGVTNIVGFRLVNGAGRCMLVKGVKEGRRGVWAARISEALENGNWEFISIDKGDAS